MTEPEVPEVMAVAAQLQRRIRCAQGLEPADLLLRQCTVVDVHLERTHRADIAILDGRIVAVREGYDGDAAEVLECAGRYAVPGLVQVLAQGCGERAFDLPRYGTTAVIEVVPGTYGRGRYRGERERDAPRLLRAAAGSPPLAVAAPRGVQPTGDAPTLLRNGHVVLVPTAAMLLSGLDCRNICLGRSESSSLAESVASAIKIGVPLPQAVQLATLNPAMAFGVDHEVGSITPGRWADIALLAEPDGFRADVVYLGGAYHRPAL